MNKKLAILLLPFILISCNGLGPKRVKNIVELTPRLSVQTNESIYLDSSRETYLFNPNTLKNKGYSFTKYKTVTEPVFVNNIVYALDIKSNISAFSKEKNSIIWSYNISRNKADNYIGGGILYHDGKLYVTYGSRLLVVLDAKSGHELIRKELPDIIRIKPIMINDDTILVQTISNQLVALNTKTLNPIWQHEGMVEVLSSSYQVAPIIYHDRVIVTYSSGQILAINTKKGEVLWSFELTDSEYAALPNFEEASILCTPISDNNNLYIASGLGKIIKLNIATGAVIWQTNANDVQSMSLIGNSLFITNNARQVAALSLASGQVKFIADLNDGKDVKKLKSAIFLAPSVSKDNTGMSLNVISVNGVLYSFHSDKDGHLNTIPTITKITKNIRYYGIGFDNNMYFSTDKKIIFDTNKAI
ncbi:PQQ-binding-like beta-propeller repeat protein [Rickettsia endosymbiont of Polydrusus tereticollis]|uniref:outer membrane protein assembly factor BamB family protein n=1 Tax=Rickettsia endosymbiont of Polydrusus tereticollis TaxID=3066251 RepID=UPI00313330A7